MQLQLQWGVRPPFAAVCVAANADTSCSCYGVVVLPARGRQSVVKKYLHMPIGCKWTPMHRTVPVTHYIEWLAAQADFQSWEAHDMPDMVPPDD